MFFLILATDATNKLKVREAVRPKHRAYLRNHEDHDVKVHLGGPTLTQDGSAMNGTLLVVEAANIDDVAAFVADDPYSHANLFAKVDIRPWSWSMGNTVSKL